MNTIAAISTGITPAGIAIIRMSGSEAIRIADNCFSGKKKLSECATHTIHYGVILNDEGILDEVLVTVMKGPHTYTGEDTVEINSHGGVLVARKILALLLQKGAKPAEPGEFTKRAFLNGRMDLAKAESVIDIIEAKNDFALKAGVKGLRGELSEKIHLLREEILDECAFIEAALDDPEHYDLTGYEEKLLPRVKRWKAEIFDFLKNSDTGRILKEGIVTVIAGRPNAGKSSLLNFLAKEEAAIVTEIEGTTRDVLEIPVRFGGLNLILKDTAGIRSSKDTVEKIGVDRAKKAMKEADLILYVFDATVGLTSEDREIISEFSRQKILLLANKTDLGAVKSPAEEKERILPISCKEKKGFSELEEKISELFSLGEISYNDQIYITNERQKEHLRNAEKALSLTEEGIRLQMPEDVLMVDLTDSYRELGFILGEEVRDDVILRVFEKFCMGK